VPAPWCSIRWEKYEEKLREQESDEQGEASRPDLIQGHGAGAGRKASRLCWGACMNVAPAQAPVMELS
jgi:hypothetical protein